MTPNSSRAIVLLSGGLDSATALAIARSKGYECRALAFDYGQRHRHELLAAAHVAAHLGNTPLTIFPLNLRAFGGSALTADIDVPDFTERADIPITYVPARNLVFLSIATALAEATNAHAIFIGVNAIDYSGYPDCRPEFIAALEHAIALGTKIGTEGHAPRILAPLSGMSKADIIRTGHHLGVDFALTHSCYNPSPQGLACARCDSCVLRRRGFEEAGIPDPTRYQP